MPSVVILVDILRIYYNIFVSFFLFRLVSLRVLIRLRCRHQMIGFTGFVALTTHTAAKGIVHKYMGEKADIQHTEIAGY